MNAQLTAFAFDYITTGVEDQARLPGTLEWWALSWFTDPIVLTEMVGSGVKDNQLICSEAIKLF